MPKVKLLELILAQLEAERCTHLSAAELARDEAIHEESRPESKYDTHSQEAAYLAGAQARLAADLAAAIVAYQTMPSAKSETRGSISLGSLVKIESAGIVTWYFLGPLRGGMQLQLGDRAITVITSQSPLGLKLMGASCGDAVTMPRGTGRILSVE